ncbi:glucoamylase family protein [Nocardioides aequoreus]|uniref:glucoamylase family protein n=1 Tax=Nocardioides aequoreus TaxID=397278 RepID=UPI0004C35D66|nr:glucoamylase family protein [Nocardioides aequoreus]
MKSRRLGRALAGGVGLVLAGTLAGVPAGTASADSDRATQSKPAKPGKPGKDQRAVMKRYLADTWRSFEALTPRSTGLPADNIGGDLDPATRSGYTSPTNIGAYLWSTVVARDTGLISRNEAHRRMKRTLTTLSGMQRHEGSGMFYNWYDETTGERLEVFPGDEAELEQFLSSVDNGWLATGLLIAGNADKRLARQADAVRESMDFSCFYNPDEGQGGQMRGGFWDEPTTNDAAVTGDYCGMGQDVWYTGHHYGAFNSESRIASYVAIAAGQVPAKHYFGTFRTFPGDTCDWSWTEAPPVGRWERHRGVDVFQGALRYRGMQVVPSWGGSMFEALMVPLFVPEDRWGKRSWGRNHPLFVKGQIEHGMEEAGYGYWGFSPSNDPAGGYREYGVDALGLDGAGYTSDQERTDWEQPWEECGRAGEPAPTAADYGDGVVTPHASFLAMRFAPRQALRNLANIREDFGAYGPGGFYDAVGTRSGDVSREYLALDQGMIVAALGNALADDTLREHTARGGMERRLKPVMGLETFNVRDREGRR